MFGAIKSGDDLLPGRYVPSGEIFNFLVVFFVEGRSFGGSFLMLVLFRFSGGQRAAVLVLIRFLAASSSPPPRAFFLIGFCRFHRVG
jgi:hypothetical protein